MSGAVDSFGVGCLIIAVDENFKDLSPSYIINPLGKLEIAKPNLCTFYLNSNENHEKYGILSLIDQLEEFITDAIKSNEKLRKQLMLFTYLRIVKILMFTSSPHSNAFESETKFLVYPFQVPHIFNQSVFGVYPPNSNVTEIDSDSIFEFGIGYLTWKPLENGFYVILPNEKIIFVTGKLPYNFLRINIGSLNVHDRNQLVNIFEKNQRSLELQAFFNNNKDVRMAKILCYQSVYNRVCHGVNSVDWSVYPIQMEHLIFHNCYGRSLTPM